MPILRLILDSLAGHSLRMPLFDGLLPYEVTPRLTDIQYPFPGVQTHKKLKGFQGEVKKSASNSPTLGAKDTKGCLMKICMLAQRPKA